MKRKTARPSARSQTIGSELRLSAIDAALAVGGLVRSGRKSGRTSKRAVRPEASAAELRRLSAPPRVAANGVSWLPIPGWELSWLWSGFSTRKGGLSRAYCGQEAAGELNLGFTAADEREAVEGNRRLLVEALTGDQATPLAVIRQFHSNLIVRASREEARRARPRKAGAPSDRWLAEPVSLGYKADGIFTDLPGLLLAVQVADCIPVLVADRKRRVVGAFHAGWRGTVKRIVELGVGRMRLEFGCRPQDLMAAIGPGIGPCCYAVGEEVIAEFESQFAYSDELFHEVYDADRVRQKYPMLFLTQRAPGHSPIGPEIHLDLVEANRRQLLAADVKAKAIEVIGGCTCCQPELFFSHRGAQGHAGRMMGMIGVSKSAS